MRLGRSAATVYEGDPQVRSASRKPPSTSNLSLDVNASHLIIMRNPRNKGLVVQVFNRDQRGRDRDRGPDEIQPGGRR